MVLTKKHTAHCWKTIHWVRLLSQQCVPQENTDDVSLLCEMTSLVDPAIQCYPPFFLVHVLPQPWVGLIQAHFQVLKGAVDSQGGAEGGRTWGNYWEVGAIPRSIPSRKYHKIPYQWAHFRISMRKSSNEMRKLASKPCWSTRGYHPQDWHRPWKIADWKTNEDYLPLKCATSQGLCWVGES